MSEESLKAQLTLAMKTAMKAKQKDRLGVLRLALSALKQIEVDERIELDNARILAILDKMVKQRRDAITQYEQAGRQELADQEKYEISVIQEFLPKALSEAEIKALIQEAVNTLDATSMKDMGKVMGTLKPKLQGRADMNTVSRLVKDALT